MIDGRRSESDVVPEPASRGSGARRALDVVQHARSRVALVATPAVVAATIMLIVAGSGVFTTSQHPDEDVYVWASGYLVHQVATIDTKFEPDAEDWYPHPHWYPRSDWSLGMGTSTRILYGLGLVATPGTKSPELPYSWTLPAFQGPETAAAPGTLRVMRLIAVLCAALGIGLVARRFGWAAVLAAVVILAVPGGIATFSRAWAEGPLLLGFGLCAAAYGTRWFAPALGLAATFKLTALGLWPLVLLRRGRVIGLWQGLVAMVGVFVLLNPPSWVTGGPLYIVQLFNYRATAWDGQSSDGAFIPSRYFWPFELALVLGAAWVVPRVVARYRASRPSTSRSAARSPAADG